MESVTQTTKQVAFPESGLFCPSCDPTKAVCPACFEQGVGNKCVCSYLREEGAIELDVTVFFEGAEVAS